MYKRQTLSAFLRDGVVAPTLAARLDEAETHLATLAALGIDLDAVAAELQAEHLAASDQRFQSLVQAVVHKRDTLDVGGPTLTTHLGAAQATVDEGLHQLCRHNVIGRIWAADHTAWPVSYTHLDVYKRQRPRRGSAPSSPPSSISRRVLAAN